MKGKKELKSKTKGKKLRKNNRRRINESVDKDKRNIF